MESFIKIIIIIGTTVIITDLISQIFSTIRKCNENKYEYLKLKESSKSKE